MWKYVHSLQHEAYNAGKPNAVSARRSMLLADEFEKAIEQRGRIAEANSAPSMAMDELP